MDVERPFIKEDILYAAWLSGEIRAVVMIETVHR